MAVSFHRDDANQRIIVVVTGPLVAAEILSVVDRQAEEGIWAYGCLYDERQMTMPPRVVDVAPIAQYVQQLSTVHGRRGPVAVVASRTGSVALSARLSNHVGFAFQVFDDVSDAERWLAQRGQRTMNAGG